MMQIKKQLKTINLTSDWECVYRCSPVKHWFICMSCSKIYSSHFSPNDTELLEKGGTAWNHNLLFGDWLL